MGSETSSILLGLFLMFALAKLVGEGFERLRQPVVIGELLVGVLLGASGIIRPSPVYEVIAEIGIIVLLFSVGLETRLHNMLRVGRMAVVVAFWGVILPFAFGYGVDIWSGGNSFQAFVVGAALVATSIGITARVLGDLGVLNSTVARVIVGAAVADDIIALILVSVVSGVSKGSLNVPNLVLSVLEGVGFVALVALVGTRAVRRYGSLLERLHITNAPFVVSLLICLGLSVLATTVGLSALIGAYLAGMAFAETKDQYALERRVQPLYDFLVPFFFVFMGVKVELGALLRVDALLLAMVITILAMIGKIVGCGLGAIRLGALRASIVGVGMMPRGEMGIVLASLGLGLGIISNQIYTTIIFMSIVTTFATPPLLKALFALDHENKGA